MMGEIAKMAMRYSISALLMLLLNACGDKKIDLLTDIKEADANEIIAALHNSGIEAQKIKTKKNSSVIIKTEYLAKSVEVLIAQGLPRQKHATLGEVFKKEGMISTPLEEKARYVYALSQELEKTLSQIDGVLIARVHIVLSEKRGVGLKPQKPSAAVFIKHLDVLDPDTVSLKIKRIIVSSVPGLSNADIGKVTISFIKSAEKTNQIKWVEQWGFRMSVASALRLRTFVQNIVYLTVFLIVITLFITIIILKKRKVKGEEMDNNSAKGSIAESEKKIEDVFNGEPIG